MSSDLKFHGCGFLSSIFYFFPSIWQEILALRYTLHWRLPSSFADTGASWWATLTSTPTANRFDAGVILPEYSQGNGGHSTLQGSFATWFQLRLNNFEPLFQSSKCPVWKVVKGWRVCAKSFMDNRFLLPARQRLSLLRTNCKEYQSTHCLCF